MAIANLCSSSQNFEKLVLKRILEIQELTNVDLTGAGQHGFKRKRSTATLGLTIQTIIAAVGRRGLVGIFICKRRQGTGDLIPVEAK